MSSLKIDRNIKTLRELTLEKLRNAIIQGHFKPGDRLVERTLCDQLGVSRTVVREVLRHLETEGLVQTLANQGPMVATLDVAQVREIYELRGLLEAYAAKACAENADAALVDRLKTILAVIEEDFARGALDEVLVATERFYAVVFEGAGKTVTYEVVRSLNARINQLRALTIATPGRGTSSNVEMKALLDAIERGDGKAAAAASTAHIKRAADLALVALESLSGPRAV